MEQLKLFRIKSAGNNISNIGFLLLVSNIVPVIAFFHISNLDLSDSENIKTYYIIYGLIYWIISISIMVNVLNAGSNLSLCDVENENKQTVYRKTTDNKTLKIISTDYKTIGAEVFIDEEIAPNGEYKYLNDNRTLIVKDGKIETIHTV